jgi:hypothetical protein
MRTLALEIVRTAALAAGVPGDRVMDASAADNLTLPRPRVEVAFLPDTLTRTGRKLDARREGKTLTVKKELYEVRFDLTAHVYADSEAWLEEFEYAFVQAFPRGLDDERGNWVRIRVAEGTFKTEPKKRVGTAEIKVFTKVDTLFLITLTGRVTEEAEQGLIDTIKIAAPKMAQGGKYDQGSGESGGESSGGTGTGGG